MGAFRVREDREQDRDDAAFFKEQERFGNKAEKVNEFYFDHDRLTGPDGELEVKHVVNRLNDSKITPVDPDVLNDSNESHINLAKTPYLPAKKILALNKMLPAKILTEFNKADDFNIFQEDLPPTMTAVLPKQELTQPEALMNKLVPLEY